MPGPCCCTARSRQSAHDGHMPEAWGHIPFSWALFTIHKRLPARSNGIALLWALSLLFYNGVGGVPGYSIPYALVLAVHALWPPQQQRQRRSQRRSDELWHLQVALGAYSSMCRSFCLVNRDAETRFQYPESCMCEPGNPVRVSHRGLVDRVCVALAGLRPSAVGAACFRGGRSLHP